MAKFCGNCGTQLDDNAKICGQCGTPLDGVPTSISGLKVVDSQKQERMKKTVKKVAVLTVIIVVAVIAVNIILQFTGYNGLLRKVMAAYEDYDIDTLISLSSNMYYYGEEDGVESYFEYRVGGDLDSFEVSVGHNYKLSYEVNETYILSVRQFEEILNKIIYSYPEFDASMIKKIVVADLTVTARQGSQSINRDMDIVMSKEDGSWRLLYIE